MRRIPWIPALVLLAIGTIAIGFPLARWNTSIRERHTFAFPDLQDTQSETRARKILDAWKADEVKKEVEGSMKLDLAFPLFYAPLLALIAVRASRNAQRRLLRILGVVIAFGALAAGVCDLLENMTMLRMLAANDASRIGMVQLFGTPKNLLLMTATLYGLFAQFER